MTAIWSQPRVLSGNRNFEGRISPDVRANYLASPPLVVAYALAGTMDTNLASHPLGNDKDGNPVYLKDIWPTQAEIAELVEQTVTREAFQSKYAEVFTGDEKWQGVETTDSLTYDWPASSTYVQNPPYFQGMSAEPGTISNVEGARILALLGDMITTDHISPAGSFKDTTPAGQYLVNRQVPVREFNSYGSRRGNHQVMMRGTFANIRIKNEMLDGVEGGYTKGPDGELTSIYDASMAYQEAGVPLVVIGGVQYGAGSSRDWAAKGTALLGVKAVIAESFERIHRSNLVGMGVIPFEFTKGDNRNTLGLTGEETITITGLEGDLQPLSEVPCRIDYPDGSSKEIALKCRIDTAIEKEYIEHGGVLHYVLRDLGEGGLNRPNAWGPGDRPGLLMSAQYVQVCAFLLPKISRGSPGPVRDGGRAPDSGGPGRRKRRQSQDQPRNCRAAFINLWHNRAFSSQSDENAAGLWPCLLISSGGQFWNVRVMH